MARNHVQSDAVGCCCSKRRGEHGTKAQRYGGKRKVREKEGKRMTIRYAAFIAPLPSVLIQKALPQNLEATLGTFPVHLRLLASLAPFSFHLLCNVTCDPFFFARLRRGPVRQLQCLWRPDKTWHRTCTSTPVQSAPGQNLEHREPCTYGPRRARFYQGAKGTGADVPGTRRVTFCRSTEGITPNY